MTQFGSTTPFTLGVEEEFQIIDPSTGELVSRIDEVLGRADGEYDENIKSELFQSVVETATDICADIVELREEIVRLRTALFDLMENKGYTIAAAGTHPFAEWKEQDVTEAERYKNLLEDMRWAAERELIFGQHVHVAVDSPSEAIYVTNWIRPFLPLLLALSTNSPFWRGERTGFKSSRIRIFDSLPRTGIPRTFTNFPDFLDTVEQLKKGGSIDDITTIWWDVRPRPDLGTVEVRIADLPTTVEESVALAGLTQALVVRLARAHARGEPPLIDHDIELIQENRWRALRDGMDACFIQREEDQEGEFGEIPAPTAVRSALEMVEEVAPELGVEKELDSVRRIAEKGRTGAERQVDIFEESDEQFLPVVSDMVERTRP